MAKTFREIIEKAFKKSEQFKEMPLRVTTKHLDALFEEGLIISGETEFSGLLEQMRSAAQRDSIIELPRDYKISIEEANYLIKALSSRDVINLTSVPVIRDTLEELKKQDSSLERKLSGFPDGVWSAGLAKTARLYPYHLLKQAVKIRREMKTPSVPIGYVWNGTDRHARAVSWMRSIDGARLFADDLSGEKKNTMVILDKKIYERNIGAVVIGDDGKYEVQLMHLPIFKESDSDQYSAWVDLAGSCTCKDVKYNARFHGKRKQKTYLFCKHQIAAFYKLMNRTDKFEEKGDARIQINPFVIPEQTVIKLIEFLENNVYITGRRPLTKTEINSIIGAYVLHNKRKENEDTFDKAFYTWGEKGDISYLRTNKTN